MLLNRSCLPSVVMFVSEGCVLRNDLENCIRTLQNVCMLVFVELPSNHCCWKVQEVDSYFWCDISRHVSETAERVWAKGLPFWQKVSTQCGRAVYGQHHFSRQNVILVGRCSCSWNQAHQWFASAKPLRRQIQVQKKCKQRLAATTFEE